MRAGNAPDYAFQSTPPSREATCGRRFPSPPSRISIHASLAGGDGGPTRRRAPPPHFNPRLPRGRRRKSFRFCGSLYLISIHASLAGGDLTDWLSLRTPTLFQSTPPSREATTLNQGVQGSSPSISIHASLAGGDFPIASKSFVFRYFNPRLPRGRRQQDIPLFCLWNTTYGNSCEFVVRDAAFPSLLWRKSGEFRLVLVRTDRGNGRSFRFARLGILPMICF